MRRILALIVATMCAGAGAPSAPEHLAPDADIVIHAVDDAPRVWTQPRGNVERTGPPDGRRRRATLGGPRA